MNELAAILGLEKSSVSGLVDRAERRGLVVRAVSDSDRRSVRVSVTPTGRRLISAVAAEFGSSVARLTGELGERDRDALAGLAARVVLHEASRRGVDPLETSTGSPTSRT